MDEPSLNRRLDEMDFEHPTDARRDLGDDSVGLCMLFAAVKYWSLKAKGPRPEKPDEALSFYGGQLVLAGLEAIWRGGGKFQSVAPRTLEALRVLRDAAKK
jgi:hypothetical protein